MSVFVLWMAALSGSALVAFILFVAPYLIGFVMHPDKFGAFLAILTLLFIGMAAPFVVFLFRIAFDKELWRAGER